jgi:hypothetical protein
LDAAGLFHAQFTESLWKLSKQYLVRPTELLLIGGISLLILLVSIFRIYTQARFANYQFKFQQVMFINVIAGVITITISNQIAPQLLLIFVPPIAFFIVHYLLEIRRRLWSEVLASMVFVLVLGWSYIIFLQPAAIKEGITFSSYFAKTELLPTAYAGKSVWVIGDNESFYASGSLGSKYFNWGLSKQEVTQLGFYGNVENVLNDVEKNEPEVIVDLEGVMPDLIRRAPSVGKNYEQVSGTPYYLLKP